MLSKLSNIPSLRALGAAAVLALLPATAAFAQVTPAASHTPPDDTPSFKIGTTIFTGYTYQDSPTSKDADGNVIHPNSFEVQRAYINVTGNLSHRISWRVTPDIAGRFSTSATSTVTGGVPGETVTTKASTNYDGNLVFRLKYAFGQFNLDDWLPKGSWIRIGQQHTPYIDFYEHIYEYRMQGTIFPERQGYITSSDVGLASHLSFPNNYGDVHFGIYNGDGYSKAEANDQKAFQARASFRPIPKDPVLKGLRITGFFDADHALKSAVRSRYIGTLTYEHEYVSFGADLLSTKDRAVRFRRRGQGLGLLVLGGAEDEERSAALVAVRQHQAQQGQRRPPEAPHHRCGVLVQAAEGPRRLVRELREGRLRRGPRQAQREALLPELPVRAVGPSSRS